MYYFLSNALGNMNFEPILNNLEPFICWIPERVKTITMNMGKIERQGLVIARNRRFSHGNQRLIDNKVQEFHY